MQGLGIISYGISITTLEEVFLHINKEFGLDFNDDKLDKNTADSV